MDKLQRAGRDFLLRLVAQHGLAGAARILRALADELTDLLIENQSVAKPIPVTPDHTKRRKRTPSHATPRH